MHEKKKSNTSSSAIPLENNTQCGTQCEQETSSYQNENYCIYCKKIYEILKEEYGRENLSLKSLSNLNVKSLFKDSSQKYSQAVQATTLTQNAWCETDESITKVLKQHKYRISKSAHLANCVQEQKKLFLQSSNINEAYSVSQLKASSGLKDINKLDPRMCKNSIIDEVVNNLIKTATSSNRLPIDEPVRYTNSSVKLSSNRKMDEDATIHDLIKKLIISANKHHKNEADEKNSILDNNYSFIENFAKNLLMSFLTYSSANSLDIDDDQSVHNLLKHLIKSVKKIRKKLATKLQNHENTSGRLTIENEKNNDKSLDFLEHSDRSETSMSTTCGRIPECLYNYNNRLNSNSTSQISSFKLSKCSKCNQQDPSMNSSISIACSKLSKCHKCNNLPKNVENESVNATRLHNIGNYTEIKQKPDRVSNKDLNIEKIVSKLMKSALKKHLIKYNKYNLRYDITQKIVNKNSELNCDDQTLSAGHQSETSGSSKLPTCSDVLQCLNNSKNKFGSNCTISVSCNRLNKCQPSYDLISSDSISCSQLPICHRNDWKGNSSVTISCTQIPACSTNTNVVNNLMESDTPINQRTRCYDVNFCLYRPKTKALLRKYLEKKEHNHNKKFESKSEKSSITDVFPCDGIHSDYIYKQPKYIINRVEVPISSDRVLKKSKYKTISKHNKTQQTSFPQYMERVDVCESGRSSCSLLNPFPDCSVNDHSDNQFVTRPEPHLSNSKHKKSNSIPHNRKSQNSKNNRNLYSSNGIEYQEPSSSKLSFSSEYIKPKYSENVNHKISGCIHNYNFICSKFPKYNVQYQVNTHNESDECSCSTCLEILRNLNSELLNQQESADSIQNKNMKCSKNPMSENNTVICPIVKKKSINNREKYSKSDTILNKKFCSSISKFLNKLLTDTSKSIQEHLNINNNGSMDENENNSSNCSCNLCPNLPDCIKPIDNNSPTMPNDTEKYAVVRISDYNSYCTYEIMKTSIEKPKSFKYQPRDIFVVKKQICNSRLESIFKSL